MRRREPGAGAPAIDWIERAAFGASFLCLVHCLGLPLILAALPAISRAVAIPEHAHVWLLGFATPTAALTLITGYRIHGAKVVPFLGGVGLLSMAAGALVVGESATETIMTVAGSFSLAAAHVANWRLRHHRHRCD